MLKQFLLRLKAKHVEALREQKGQSIIIFTAAFLGLIAFLGLALDLGLVYIEKVKVGRTTDAATLAGVPELTNNNEAATIDRAIEYIRLNGYDVGGDTEIRVRGCVPSTVVSSTLTIGPGNVYEGGVYTTTGTTPMTKTTAVTGALYVRATKSPLRATFMIDTGSYQSVPANCNPAGSSFGGNAQKVQVAGKVNVHMSFMQFFGFRELPVADEAVAENLTTLDVVVVFDISGSMEDQTICHDCWVRTTYGITATPYPGNGYFNPIPFNRNLLADPINTTNVSVPPSQLCTNPPTPHLQQNGSITYSYLTVEAELYSANVGNWNLNARVAGQGFWSIQRGSRGSTVPSGISSDEVSEAQGNRAGSPTYQSSNLCHPALTNAINCTIKTPNANNDDVCRDDSGINNSVDVRQDCSSYISARPFISYGQQPGNIPNPTGATYNLSCFLEGTGPFTPTATVLSGRCWTNDRVDEGDFNNPFYDPINGPLKEPGPSNVPWVEYDFTPTWANSTTYIWIRAAGGGDEAFTYAGPSPDNLSPDSNGGGTSNNLSLWDDSIFWQINQGEVHWQEGGVEIWDNWQDSRAEPSDWRWVRLGSTSTVSGTQYTLRLYQGSPGYKVDKIVFTNDSNSAVPPAMRRRLTTAEGGSGGTASSDGREAVGPPASYGSATREACNVCNPVYGNTVNTADCSCLKNATEATKRYKSGSAGYDPTFYGTGSGCSIAAPGGSISMLANVVTMTVSAPEVQPPQTQTRTVVNDLYSGNQPIRSAQEAVKNFVLGLGVEEQYRLKPGFDQVGFVSFTTNVIDTDASRSKLQCLRTKNPPPADALTCYADVLTAVERQWPNNSTNIAEGLREGLEELGISVGSNTVDSTCTGAENSGHSCDRGGAAKRVLILMTDGSPNAYPSGCTGQTGYADYWEGLIGNEKTAFECAMWYAQQAAAKGVIVYTIGIGGGANADYLQTMATGTDPRSGGTPVPMFPGVGGQYFPAATPADLDGIFRIILTSISVRIVG